MSKGQTLQSIGYKTASCLQRHSSTILTCLGAIGVVGTAVVTAKSTLKAKKLVDAATSEKGEELTAKEIVLTAGTAYIPSIVLSAATISCIFGANILNKRCQASLVSAYMMVDTAYKDYRNKVKEMFGDETDIQIRDAIAMDKRDEKMIAYVPGFNSLVSDDAEKVLFYEEYRKGYFEAPMEAVINAEYHLNRNLAMRGCVNLNEFYEFLGLSTTNFGNALGWSWWKLSYEYDSSWIDFDHRLITMPDGSKCYSIDIVYPPTTDYCEDD